MAITIVQTLDIIEALENFLDRKRPPLEMREEVDLTYEIDGKNIIVFERRCLLNNPEEIIEIPISKCTYIMSKDIWKVFWYRADGKWQIYLPLPYIQSLDEYVNVLEEDQYGCFFG